MKTSEKLAALRIINAGCKAHPKYQAARPPKSPCGDCAEMWSARQKLRLAAQGKL